MKHERCRY